MPGVLSRLCRIKHKTEADVTALPQSRQQGAIIMQAQITAQANQRMAVYQRRRCHNESAYTVSNSLTLPALIQLLPHLLVEVEGIALERTTELIQGVHALKMTGTAVRIHLTGKRRGSQRDIGKRQT